MRSVPFVAVQPTVTSAANFISMDYSPEKQNVRTCTRIKLLTYNTWGILVGRLFTFWLPCIGAKYAVDTVSTVFTSLLVERFASELEQISKPWRITYGDGFGLDSLGWEHWCHQDQAASGRNERASLSCEHCSSFLWGHWDLNYTSSFIRSIS